MKKYILVSLAAACLAFIGVWTVKSYYLANKVDKVIKAISQGTGGQYQIEYDASPMEGFPFTAATSLKNLRLIGNDKKEIPMVGNINIGTSTLGINNRVNVLGHLKIPLLSEPMEIIFDGQGFFELNKSPVAIQVVLNNLEIKSRFGISQFDGGLNLKKDKEKNLLSGSYQLKGNSAVQAGKHGELLDYIGKTLRELNQNEDTPLILTFAIESWDQFKSTIPDFSEWGLMKGDIDVDFNFSVPKTSADHPKYDLDIKQMHFSSKPLNFELYGQIAGDDEQPESAHLNYQLKNYKLVVENLITYTNKILTLVSNTANRQLSIQKIPEQYSHLLVDYLRSLSNVPNTDSEDLNMTFELNNEDFKVGTKSATEVSQSAMAFMIQSLTFFHEQK